MKEKPLEIFPRALGDLMPLLKYLNTSHILPSRAGGQVYQGKERE